MNILNIARDVFDLEAREIKSISNLLDSNFERAVKDIFESKGKVIVTGMGKSGIIGKKIAATLASTGTPSFFLHSGEAYHGDLGMIEREDIVLLISNSGETDEVLKLIPFLKERGNRTISITGRDSSTLSTNTDYHLNVKVEKEACPLQLAPTSSTTATLVMGDALAVTLMKLRDFRERDFATFHPGGNLGRRLLTRVETVMKSENLPICKRETSIKEVIHNISRGKVGLTVVLNGKKIEGIVTDGDIRRAMEQNEDRFFSLKAEDIMTLQPKTISMSEKLEKANELMNQHKINSLLVVNEHSNLVGTIQMYDLGV
jgi:arabinose-5-phosphate isomerase